MSHIVAVAFSKDNNIRLVLSQGTTPMVVITFKGGSTLTIQGADVIESAQITQSTNRLQIRQSGIDLVDTRLFGTDWNIESVSATTSSGAAAIYLMVVLSGWIGQIDPEVQIGMKALVSPDEINNGRTLAWNLGQYLTASRYPTFIGVDV